jgi:hypothetical protein
VAGEQELMMTDETQAVAVAPPEQMPVATPGQMLAAIIQLSQNPNVRSEVITSLTAAMTTMEDRASDRMLTRDLFEIQQALPAIPKRGVISLGAGKGTIPYATLPDVMRAVQPLLDQYRMTISHTMLEPRNDKLAVRTILRHPAGGEMHVDMWLPVDTGPGRNTTQAHMSSDSYGHRRGVKAIFNIRDEDAFDDDGASAHLKTMDDVRLKVLVDLLKEGGGSEPALLTRYYGDKYRTLEEVPAGEFLKLKSAIEERNQAVAAKRAKEG